MRGAFTLAEVMVATVIILVVLGALAVALLSFARGSRTMELQDGALTLARLEIAGIENARTLPEPGVTTRPDSLWGNRYTVETSVIGSGDGSTMVTVAVGAGEESSIELTRRFYH